MGNLRGGTVFHGTVGQPTAQVIDGSLQFINNSKYLNRTHGSGNQRTWTWSGWFKRDALGANDNIFKVAGSSTKATQFTIMIHNGNFISIDYGGAFYLKSNRLIRDLSSWYNFVVRVDTTLSTANDRVRLYVNGVEETSFATRNNPNKSELLGLNRNSAHTISTNDVSGFDGRFSNFYLIDGQSLGPEHFGFTDPLTNTWRPKKFIKQATPNNGTVWSDATVSGSGSIDSSYPLSNAFNGASDGNNVRSSGANTDITITFPQSIPFTSSIRIFQNQNGTAKINDESTVATSSGGVNWVTVFTGSGTFSSLTLTSTGGDTVSLYEIEVDGVPLLDSDSANVGVNGFYLPMDTEDNFGRDKLGKQNNWTENGFSGTFNDPDVVKDSPSGAVSGGRAQTGITTTSSAPSNYCTWNPLIDTVAVISNGNLDASNTNSTTRVVSPTMIPISKCYWEITVDTPRSGPIGGIHGVNSQGARPDNSGGAGIYLASSANGGGIYVDGTKTLAQDSGGAADDVASFAFDPSTRELIISLNGVTQATVTAPDTDDLQPVSALNQNASIHANFGQKPFKYAPPQGYLPLNSASARPETVIPRSNQYVGIMTYTGTSASTATVTSENIKFTPDFVWCKYRDGTEGYAVYDSVRGGETLLRTNTKEEDTAGANNLKTFIPGGFTTGNNGHVYYNGYAYVSWMWKAGGNKNTFNVDNVGYSTFTTAPGLNSGTIALTGCSVGTRQGFSILKYTGSGSNGTLAHGLSQAPDFFFGRDLDDTSDSRDWIIYHKSIGNTGRLKFTQDGTSTSSTFFQDTSPTNSLITVGTSNDINSTNGYILYCWHDVPGLQKFGSYGGADAFVDLGFRPALLIIKSLSSSRNWILIDNERDTFNPSNNALLPNDSAAEDDNTAYDIDFLSNGFKVRGSNGQIDGDTTYVYAAWAEAPASNLFGGQSNAR